MEEESEEQEKDLGGQSLTSGPPRDKRGCLSGDNGLSASPARNCSTQAA